MTKPQENELDEILLAYQRWASDGLGPDLRLPGVRLTHDEAKAKLLKLKQQWEAEAQIRELSNVQLQHGRYLTQTFVHGQAMTVEERIAELRSLLVGKEKK